ncbi:MAG: NAD(P)H-dependent oxidoreductase [Oscillospiraceae bacterium]|nr:NAD(P)H-dependent oxidoreductase [Oscillospiraceae bacterium]
MKKIVAWLLTLAMIVSLSACGGSTTLPADGKSGTTSEPDTPASIPAGGSANMSDAAEPVEGGTDNSKILVAVSSLAAEQYEVGVIEEGNTAIIADMIVEQTGADLFRIENVTPYPETYDGLLEISRQEEAADTRPEISKTVDNMEDYDTIFLCYPIWWGDMPMIVYGFLESYDFSGKTIVPVCTHGGSGLSNTPQHIADTCPDATIADGLAIRGKTAQEQRDSAKETVTDWLREGGFIE